MCLCVQEVSHFQLTMEKASLQKCLLYFENLHGQPVRRVVPENGWHLYLFVYYHQ